MVQPRGFKPGTFNPCHALTCFNSSTRQVRHSPGGLRADGGEHVLRLVPDQGGPRQDLRRRRRPAQDLPHREIRHPGGADRTETGDLWLIIDSTRETRKNPYVKSPPSFYLT